GKRHKVKTTIFDRPAKKARYEVQTATLVTTELAVPPSTLDALSTLYVLRTIPLKANGTVTMAVCDNGNLYNVSMQIGGVEPVRTPLGTLNGIRITPRITSSAESPARSLAIWISDDARRLPLRIEAGMVFGSFTLTLTSVTGS